MKIAVVGSRTLQIPDLESYLPPQTSEIVSGGAKGIDQCAAQCAERNGWKLTEFLPEYSRYGRAAPVIRSRRIVEYADAVLAFWDGCSRGTAHTIEYCRKIGREVRIICIQTDPNGRDFAVGGSAQDLTL